MTKTASDGTTSDVVVTCTGTIPKVCRKEFTSVFFSDSGNYRCDGSNVINGETKSSTDNKNLTVGMFCNISSIDYHILLFFIIFCSFLLLSLYIFMLIFIKIFYLLPFEFSRTTILFAYIYFKLRGLDK